jgi:hypothetical protein
VVTPEPGHELERTDEDVAGGADDVRHERQRERGESVVGRDELRTAGELDQS